MNTTVDLGPGAQRLAELIARVTDDELVNPTPCPAYTVGDLIEHIGGLARAFTAAAGKESGRYVEQNPPGQASRLEQGWRARIPTDLRALARAWREPGCEPQLLDAARRFLTMFASPDAPAGPDVAFGPSRRVPADAPELERVVAFAGRDVSWRPAGGAGHQE
jgi:hypothetical protein